MRDVVVVGASLAGLRAAEALRRAGFDGRLRLIGEEVHAPYDRPPLSKTFLLGDATPDSIRLRQSADLDAEWLLGCRADRLNGEGRSLLLADGSTVTYDGLVIATGSTPRLLPGLPAAAPGLHVLRTLDDAAALRAELAGSPRVVIVGGGFIGSELASTCRSLGLDVTVVTPIPLLVTALGPLSVAASTRARDHGVRIVELGVTGVEVSERVTGVRLSDDNVLPADVVVIAVGAVPAADWLEGSGATVRDGVVCDETLAVEGLSGAVAAGDVAQWPHPALAGKLLRLEHWTNATDQATAAARRLLDNAAPAYAPVPSFWSDQFGVRLQGVGLPPLADDVVTVDGDPAGDNFLAEYRLEGRLVGAVGAGSPKALVPYRRELAQRFLVPLTS